MKQKERKITKVYPKEYIKHEYLPCKLIDKINHAIFYEKKLEYRTKNNFLRCVSTIYFKQVNEYHDLEYYVPAGSAYWKTLFGGDYHEKVIQPLIDLDIIQFMDFGYRTYSKKSDLSGKGKQRGLVGIRYRINPDLTDDNSFVVIEYFSKGNGEVKTAEESILNNGEDFIFEEAIHSKNLVVRMDQNKAIKWVECHADEVCQEYLKVNYADELPQDSVIEFHLFLDGGSFVKGFSTIMAAKMRAKMHGKQLFYFKDRFYIADPKTCTEHRVKSLKHDYRREISKIGAIPVFNRRSPKTLRIYNHLVNFPSKILHFITLNNRTVVQLDLRTSQFLIFSNILNTYLIGGETMLMGLFKKKQTQTYIRRLVRVLKQHQHLLPTSGISLAKRYSDNIAVNDVNRFIADVFHEDFYSVVQKKLNLPDRGLAKQMLFRLLFKRNNKPDLWIRMLTQLYPTVMSIVSGFKALGDIDESSEEQVFKDDLNNFSVFLQCVESEIFIDNIFKPLLEAGIPCFTRHDSIVVASGYEDQAELYARTVFGRFGFKYNHKVEDKMWEYYDESEIDEVGYLDWLSDEYELSTDFSLPDSLEKPTINEIQPESDEGFAGLDDEQLMVVEELLALGEHDDYSEIIGIGFLEALTVLPIRKEDKNILYDEITNLKSGMVLFQEDTNELILKLAERFIKHY